MSAHLRALITGVTGQDGSYLAEFLLERGYMVYGTKRKSSTAFNTSRIDHLLDHERFVLHYADVTDLGSMIQLVADVKPDEVYNLAAQSDVGISFQIPYSTMAVTGVGTMNVLDAVKLEAPEARVYQASSSEMFGNAPSPQSMKTPFSPVSPYGAAKLLAHTMAGIHRDASGMYISRGVLFNHESPRRGETFVTRKITRGIARIKCNLQDKLILGNPSARRDWGYAVDYVEAMWLMLQGDCPQDHVIGTGISATVLEFLQYVATTAGVDQDRIDWNADQYTRPLELNYLCADITEAREQLGWMSTTNWRQLADLMLDHDLKLAEKELRNQ